MQPVSDILGIILARGGSKRIPHKNIVPVNGKPLMAYTCEAATKSKLLTRVVLSTDDEEIAAIGREYGVEVPFIRPDELASDEANSMDAIRHTLNELEKQEQYTPSLIVLLQPTSPLRTADHIDKGITLMKQSGADSIVSVNEIPYLPRPLLAMRIEGDRLITKMPEPSKNMEKFYAYNGAVYVLRADRLLQSKDPFGDNCKPLIMDQESSIDIDTQPDLELAEFLLKKANT